MSQENAPIHHVIIDGKLVRCHCLEKPSDKKEGQEEKKNFSPALPRRTKEDTVPK